MDWQRSVMASSQRRTRVRLVPLGQCVRGGRDTAEKDELVAAASLGRAVHLPRALGVATRRGRDPFVFTGGEVGRIEWCHAATTMGHRDRADWPRLWAGLVDDGVEFTFHLSRARRSTSSYATEDI